MKVYLVAPMAGGRRFMARQEESRVRVLLDASQTDSLPDAEPTIALTNLLADRQMLVQALQSIQLPILDGLEHIACIDSDDILKLRIRVYKASAEHKISDKIPVCLDGCETPDQMSEVVTAALVEYWQKVAASRLAESLQAQQIVAALSNGGVTPLFYLAGKAISEEMVVRLQQRFPLLKLELRSNGPNNKFIFVSGSSDEAVLLRELTGLTAIS